MSGFRSATCPGCGRRVSPSRAGKIRRHGPKASPCPVTKLVASLPGRMPAQGSDATTAGVAEGEAAAPATIPPSRPGDAGLPRVLRDLYAVDQARPRSQQIAPGVSGLGGCAREYAERLLGTATTNETDLLAATLGTAAHDAFEAATLRRNPLLRKGVHVDVPVVVPRLGLPGKADAFLQGVVEDWKTTTNLSPSHKPTRQQRWQVQTYAYALAEAGREVRGVRLVFVPRDGRGTDAVVWEDDYRPDVALEAIAWAEQIAAGLADGYKPEPERAASSWCRDWCPFYDPEGLASGCAGLRDKPADLELAEPDVRLALLEYAQASARIKALEERRDAVKPLLTGRAGRASGLVLSWSDPKPRQVVDDAAVREQYAAAGLPLPTREETAPARISVRPAKDFRP